MCRFRGIRFTHLSWIHSQILFISTPIKNILFLIRNFVSRWQTWRSHKFKWTNKTTLGGISGGWQHEPPSSVITMEKNCMFVLKKRIKKPPHISFLYLLCNVLYHFSSTWYNFKILCWYHYGLMGSAFLR